MFCLQNHLLTNFESAKKIETQLLEVQNQTIEEFESFMEAHKAELQQKVFRDTNEGSLMESDYDEEEMELERLDTEVRGAEAIWVWLLDFCCSIVYNRHRGVLNKVYNTLR